MLISVREYVHARFQNDWNMFFVFVVAVVFVFKHVLFVVGLYVCLVVCLYFIFSLQILRTWSWFCSLLFYPEDVRSLRSRARRGGCWS